MSRKSESGERRQVSYGSGEWWRTRTDEELRESIDGNYPGGMGHDGALAELERRTSARDRRKEMFWIRVSCLLALVAAVASIVALL